MLVRSIPRVTRTGLRSQSAKHSYSHSHPLPHPHLHAYALHPSPSSSLHHAISSLPLLSCHSFRMLYSSSALTYTSISTSSTFPIFASRCFPVRSFSTEGPRDAADGSAGGGFWSRFGRRGKPEPIPDPQPETENENEAEPEPEGKTAGKQKPKTQEEEKAENPYGNGFKEKFGGKKIWNKVKQVIKWGIVLMFTYYALTDHPNVEGEAWYMTVLLKPYRTVMAMFAGDDSILIPAETPDQFGRRTRTLVINWENVLVSSDWGRQEGWSVRQRPGLDQFLARAYKAGWEIVVFCTATQEPTEQHILRADPTGGQIIKHRIFYEGTSFHEGFIVKDLNRLGRDLERVVAVDYDVEMYRLQRANLLKIIKFSTDRNDKELEKIADFLENLSRYNVHDVRPYIAKFNANPADPTMFAEEEQARMQAAERLRKAKRSLKYTGTADTTTTTTPKTSTNQPKKEEQGWLGWVKGITGVFSR